MLRRRGPATTTAAGVPPRRALPLRPMPSPAGRFRLLSTRKRTTGPPQGCSRRRRRSQGSGQGSGRPQGQGRRPPPRQRQDDGQPGAERRRATDPRWRRCGDAPCARKQRLQHAPGDPTKIAREVVVPEVITVQELANRMAERGADVIKSLMRMGVMATINQTIDADTAELVVAEFGHRISRVSESDVEDRPEGRRGRRGEPDRRGPRSSPSWATSTTARPRCSMRCARPTSPPARPAASPSTSAPTRWSSDPASKITFIDTPGHAAFTEMRARGANVTDIVVLVVAADDGIMPQTVEAINHAKAAQVPIIVAINKMRPARRQPGPGPQRTAAARAGRRRDGRRRAGVEVSAKTRTGLDKLEEAILLQAEMLELQGQSEPRRRRRRDRGEAGARPRFGRDRAGPARHAAGSATSSSPAPSGAACVPWSTTGAREPTAAGPAQPVEVLGLNGTPIGRRRVRGGRERGPRPRDHRVPSAQEPRSARRRRLARHARADVREASRKARPRNCRSSSRATCRVRSRRSAALWSV